MPDDLTTTTTMIHSLSANNLKKHFVMVNLNNFSNYSTMLQTFIHHQPSHQNQSKHQQSITLTPILFNNINIVSNNSTNNNKSNQQQPNQIIIPSHNQLALLTLSIGLIQMVYHCCHWFAHHHHTTHKYK
jgi:hypothetical protein